MSVSAFKQTMRGSTRKKEKGNGSKMGLVFAQKTLLPRGISNELKLLMLHFALFSSRVVASPQEQTPFQDFLSLAEKSDSS